MNVTRANKFIRGSILPWCLVLSLRTLINSRLTIERHRHVLMKRLQKWYTKKEMNLRMSIFYSGAMIAGAFGNLIAAGILDGLAGVRDISAWRWLYIIEGASTSIPSLLTSESPF